MKLEGRKQSDIKKDNQGAIIVLLRQRGPMSRADMAKALMSSKPTVSKNVDDLIHKGIIHEVGKGDNEVGKKAMLIDIDPEYGYVLGIDISKNRCQMAVSNAKGTWFPVDEKPLNEAFDVIETLQAYLAKHRIDQDMIRETVIGYPGVVGHQDDVYLTNAKKKEIYLQALLNYIRSEMGHKPKIRNDVNLAVLAEYVYGPHDDVVNLYYISGDMGIGSGMIIGGTLYEGDRNAAGEIGFILPSRKEEGTYVTLEERISVNALVERYQRKKGQIVEFKDLVYALKAQDPVAEALYIEVLEQMSVAITNVASILDIQQVVVGGRLFEMKEEMVEELAARTQAMTPFDTIIMKSGVGYNTLKGALYVGLETMFTKRM